MITPSLVIGIPFALVMVLSAASDLRARRIPNALTMGGTAVAPVLWGFVVGPPAAAGSVLGAGMALVLGGSLFGLGALGGGDAKLLIVTGAFLGPARLVSALIVTGIAGGLLALAVAVRQGELIPTLLRTWHVMVRLATLGRRGEDDRERTRGLTIPYGVAIAVGGLLTWFVLSPELMAI